MSHAQFSIQKSPLIIPFVSYFQAKSQAVTEQHVLLVLKVQKRNQGTYAFSYLLANSEIHNQQFPTITVGYNGQNITEAVMQGSWQHSVILDHLQTYPKLNVSTINLAMQHL